MIGGKHKERVSDTPGPGSYQAEAGGKKGKFQGSFTLEKKKDIWEGQAKADGPGPGNYVQNTSTFGTGKGQSVSISGKQKEKANQNPGVGAYQVDQRPTSAHVVIGTGKARDDVFGLKTKGELPGPGEYQSPGPKPKGVTISGKAKENRNLNAPGPGQYS